MRVAVARSENRRALAYIMYCSVQLNSMAEPLPSGGEVAAGKVEVGKAEEAEAGRNVAGEGAEKGAMKCWEKKLFCAFGLWP